MNTTEDRVYDLATEYCLSAPLSRPCFGCVAHARVLLTACKDGVENVPRLSKRAEIVLTAFAVAGVESLDVESLATKVGESTADVGAVCRELAQESLVLRLCLGGEEFWEITPRGMDALGGHEETT